MDIAKRIKKYRKHLGLTQEEVASRAGINEKYYGRIEREESHPTIDYLEKICDAMNIEILELMLLETGDGTEEHFVRNPRITSTIINGLKQDIDIHFNRNVIFDGCESCIWYYGYVGSLNFDEFEMKIYAEGNIKGTLYIDYQEILSLNSEDISNELRKYVKNDNELFQIIEYMPFDEEVLQRRNGTAFFITESNWLSACLSDNAVGEILCDDIILDCDNVIESFNTPELLFDYIFKDN